MSAVVVLFTFTIFPASAEEIKIDMVKASAGEGAFVSGFDVSIFGGNSKNAFEFTGNHQRVYAVWFWKLPLNINVGICAGAFKNQPQTGPYITISPVKPLTLFYWRGWGFGKPNEPRWEFNKFFESVGTILNLGNLKLSYIWFNFMGEKTGLPGISYGVNLNPKFKLFAGVDYKLILKRPLFYVGISQSFN